MSKTSPPQSNPYIVGNPVDGTTLYGREDVFSFVNDTLASTRQNAVVLYGQRRAGKTSILRELPRRLPVERFHCTFFDLQGQARLEVTEVLHNLSTAIAESLEIPAPHQAAFQNNKDYFRKGFLPQVWQELGHRRLVLLFDEFEVPSESKDEKIRGRAEQKFYPYMRDLLDKEKRLSFVFVIGRRIDDLTHWVKRVFKEAQYKKIGLLQRSEAIGLITEPVKDCLTYQPEAIDTILDLTSGHPFFTQLICFELFNYTQKHQSAMISPADVEAVVNPALESGELAFTWLWDAISISGRIYLGAVAQIRAENKKANKDTIQEILNAFRIRPGPDWNSVPRELADWDLIRDDTSDVQFMVRLMELWARQSHSLRDIKAALMHEGQANLKKAQTIAQQGQSDQTIKALRDLLTINPNHLGAQLTLAQTLLDQKKLEEAVSAAEDAFWIDEDIGREGLIDARLAMAQAHEKQNEFIEAAVHYRRVLELKPDERWVQEKLRTLYDRGCKAARIGDWENAANLFEQITYIDPDYEDAKQQHAAAYHQSVQPSSLKSSLFIGIAIIVLVILVSISGWFIWGGVPGLDTPTPTQAVVINANTPTTQSTTPEPTAEPTQEPTQEPTTEPTQEPTTEPTQEPTLGPSPTSTSTATPVVILVVVTATPTPTPTLPSYPAPKLISPPPLDLEADISHFVGRAAPPLLEWEPVPNLGSNDFYIVSVSYPIAIPGGERTISQGANLKGTSWEVDRRFFDEIAGSPRDFKWYIVVTHFPEGSIVNLQGITEPKGEGIEVSPRSEERIFRWD